jgi:integrase
VSWSSFNQAVCALRFFYGTTLGRPEQLALIPFGKRPKTLPSVLSPDEVLRLLNTAPPGRDRVLLQVAYGCGLRLGEVLHLRVTDIDSARMVIQVVRAREPRTAWCPCRCAGSKNSVPTGTGAGHAPGFSRATRRTEP